MLAIKLKKELKFLANKKQAEVLARFFKTGKGQYGEGDSFWGIKVPIIRGVANQFLDLELEEIQLLLNDKVHECRFAGLTVLLGKYKKAKSEEEKKAIFEFYLKNIKQSINNWDLVDLSCPQIIGNFLMERDKDILHKLSKSENLWEKRVSMISTFYFIKNNSFQDAFDIAENLINDSHDLIHKAVGWMIREVGKRDLEEEKKFLLRHYKTMPRTALRYAIEKMNKEERLFFLNK